MTPDDVYALVGSHKLISYFVLAIVAILAILTIVQIVVTIIVWNRVISLLRAGNAIFSKAVDLLQATEKHADITDTPTKTAAKRVEELERKHEQDASLLIGTTVQVRDRVEAVKATVDVIKDTVTAGDTAKHG